MLGTTQRQSENPGSTPTTLGFVKGGRSLEEIDLPLFARRVLHDVNQLGVGMLQPPYIRSHRGIAVRIRHLDAQVLPDALRRQSVSQACLDLRVERRRQSPWSIRCLRA